MFLTGALRPPVSMSAAICGLDDVCPRLCVFVCVLATTPASSGGSSGALTVNRSLWASANPLAGARALYHSIIFSFTHSHTHTQRQARTHAHVHINTPTHAFTHIPYLLTRGFCLSLSVSPCSVFVRQSLSTPFPDSGASRLLYRFQEAGKTSLEFPCPPFQASRWRK